MDAGEMQWPRKENDQRMPVSAGLSLSLGFCRSRLAIVLAFHSRRDQVSSTTEEENTSRYANITFTEF